MYSQLRPLSRPLRTALIRCNSAQSSQGWLARKVAQGLGHVVRALQRRIDSRAEPQKTRSALILADIDNKFDILRPGQVVCDLGAAPGGWSQVVVKRIRLKDQIRRMWKYHEDCMMAEKNSELPPRPLRFSRLISSDLVDIKPIQNVSFVRGDFTDPATRVRIASLIREAGEYTMLGNMTADLAKTVGVGTPVLEVKELETRLNAIELSYLFRGEKGADVVLSDMCAGVTGTSKDVASSLQLCETTLAFAIENFKQSAGPRPGTLV
ncbi:2' O-ribose methyltransferase [Ceratobasidium sp. UAMH 11750]|nr:2' O-ribose methyltransferase [Ceratobasidium sp. UAMH 11750]